MKKIVINLAALCFLFGPICIVHATLIDISGTLVYDDTTSQYWYRNISDFNNRPGSMPGDGSAIDKALYWATMNYNGLTNWHLASFTECSGLMNGTTAQELLNHFTPTGSNDPAYLNLDLGEGNYKYFVGGTNDYETFLGGTYHFPLDLFIVQVNYDILDLAQLTPVSFNYGIGDGPGWCRGGEIGAWLTATGPPPNPVPEPSTILLLVSGMAGFAVLGLLKRI